MNTRFFNRTYNGMIKDNGDNKTQLTFSELIGDAYKEWKPGESIILDGGTGTGKSYFCTMILGRYAKETGQNILYLCNRTELKNQINGYIEQYHLTDQFRVCTYQYLQQLLLNQKKIPHFNYIIVDEAHYFTMDAFNKYTDVSWEFVRANTKKSIIVYCSATATSFFKALVTFKHVKKQNHYFIEKDYSYVSSVAFYKKDRLTYYLDRLVHEYPKRKAVVFFSDGYRLVETYKQFEQYSDYYYSQHTQNRSLRKLPFHNPIKNNTFDSNLLLCTSALDNGIDLKDRNIKFIICELTDVDAITQCLGRKRPLDFKDKCIFAIRKYDSRGLNGVLSKMNKELNAAIEYMDDKDVFIKEKIHDRNFYKTYDIFYQGDENKGESPIMLNRLLYMYYKMQRTIIKEMQNRGYEKVVLEHLGGDLKNKEKKLRLKANKKQILMNFLENRALIPLFKEDKEEITESFRMLGYKLAHKSTTVFNAILDEEFPDYPYRFYKKDANGNALRSTNKKMKDGSDNPNHGKYYWILTDDSKSYRE